MKTAHPTSSDADTTGSVGQASRLSLSSFPSLAFSTFKANDVRDRRDACPTVNARQSGAWISILIVALLFLTAVAAQAQSTGANPLPFRITIDGSNQPQDLDVGIKILATITLLSLAPSLILLMTCFTRIIIVLSFVRTALQLQGAPANQIVVVLALFMTFFIMAPTWETIQRDAVAPYQAKQITSEQALERATVPIRNFMLKQARAKDVELFVGLARMAPTEPDKLPLKVVVPGFIISELRTAFQMGFLLLVPFILIDLVVAVVLMSMGMMMMPPATIALPLKILLFVLADGWGLVVRSIIQSFGS